MKNRGIALVFAFVFVQALAFFTSAATAASTNTTSAILVIVDQSGHGDFKKIQDAIDIVPPGNQEPFFILIKPGFYEEQVVVPARKPFITLSGTDAEKTIITWEGRWVNLEAVTVSIIASDFVARNITIQNTYGPGSQAVALSVVGDRAAFYGCRIKSYQDTLYDGNGRHYYRGCYLEGATDFIYGDGLAYFERCDVHSISNMGGAITAQKRSSEDKNTGYSFVSCNITGIGPNTIVLGRPWGPNARVIYAFSYMSNAVRPQGWDDWGNSTRQSTSFYGEYRNYGPGANLSGRVNWAHRLSTDEARPFITQSMINGDDWLRGPPTNFRRPSFSNSTTVVDAIDPRV